MLFQYMILLSVLVIDIGQLLLKYALNSYGEIIWKEIVTILNIKGGLMGRFFGSTGGGGEYLNGAKNGVQSSMEFLNYFTQDYATTVFASYKGRSTKEVGTQICQSAIYGKYPVVGDILNDVSAAQDVVQYTAYFQEESYSATIKGTSRYQVYYHIYAGGEEISYEVYLRKDGRKIPFKDNKGILTPGAYVDKTKDFIADSKANQICAYS